jgi:hypothetical protein
MTSKCSRPMAAALLAAVSGILVGCSGLPTDPYANGAPTSSSPVSQSPNVSPSASASPGRAATPAMPTSARAAVTSFTKAFINWRFDRLPAVKRALIPRAAGPLAIQLRRDADEALTEASRRASNQSNTGTVEAVAAKAHAVFLVITRETAHQGSNATQSGYFVYRASTIRVGNTYRLVGFEALN